MVEEGVREEDGNLVLNMVQCGRGKRLCVQRVWCWSADRLRRSAVGREVRDFPWAGRRCKLEVTLARVDCPVCRKIAVEAVS